MFCLKVIAFRIERDSNPEISTEMEISSLLEKAKSGCIEYLLRMEKIFQKNLNIF